jgi:hypothetical protein
MHHKLMLTTTRTAVIGAVIVLGAAAAAQGAMASPVHAGTVSVACTTPALISAISGASNGEKLRLAARCIYQLTAPLPGIRTGLTIAGAGATLERSEAAGTPAFTILTVDAGDVNLVRVNFRDGGGSAYDNAGAIENEGGDITVLDGTFADNSNSEEGDGAIYNKSGTLTITSVYFTLNDAEAGGAITNDAIMTLRSSRFFDNTANMGGAIYNAGTATVTGTTFTENGAFEGGALVNTGHTALSSVTIKNNSAEVAVGGGIYNDGTLTAASSNIVHNNARYGGGGIYNAASVALTLTKVTGNTPNNCDPVGIIKGCTG